MYVVIIILLQTCSIDQIEMLPNEIIVEILSFCPVRTVLASRRCCKALNDLVTLDFWKNYVMHRRDQADLFDLSLIKADTILPALLHFDTIQRLTKLYRCNIPRITKIKLKEESLENQIYERKATLNKNDRETILAWMTVSFSMIRYVSFWDEFLPSFWSGTERDRRTLLTTVTDIVTEKAKYIKDQVSQNKYRKIVIFVADYYVIDGQFLTSLKNNGYVVLNGGKRQNQFNSTNENVVLICPQKSCSSPEFMKQFKHVDMTFLPSPVLFPLLREYMWPAEILIAEFTDGESVDRDKHLRNISQMRKLNKL